MKIYRRTPGAIAAHDNPVPLLMFDRVPAYILRVRLTATNQTAVHNWTGFYRYLIMQEIKEEYVTELRELHGSVQSISSRASSSPSIPKSDTYWRNTRSKNNGDGNNVAFL